MSNEKSQNDAGKSPVPLDAVLKYFQKEANKKSLNKKQMSDIQKMVWDNLVKHCSTSKNNTSAMTFSEALDIGMGYPVTSALKGENIPFPAPIRHHLMKAYKNGTAKDAGEFMQQILPAASQVVVKFLRERKYLNRKREGIDAKWNRLPEILRWILWLPINLVVPIFLACIVHMLNDSGYGDNNWLDKLWHGCIDYAVMTSTFYIILYYLAPRFQGAISIICSIIFSLLTALDMLLMIPAYISGSPSFSLPELITHTICDSISLVIAWILTSRIRGSIKNKAPLFEVN